MYYKLSREITKGCYLLQLLKSNCRAYSKSIQMNAILLLYLYDQCIQIYEDIGVYIGSLLNAGAQKEYMKVNCTSLSFVAK